MKTLQRAAPGPTHSRTSPLDLVGRPPASGESHYPHAPDGFPCDVTRLDVDLTYYRYADSLVEFGLFHPRAGVRPARDAFRGSVPRDRDCANPGAGATHPVLSGPASALDVSVQERLLNLFQDLQQQRGIACLFVTNALNVASKISDRATVMHAGGNVEVAETNRVHRAPWHPISSIPLEAALLTALHAPLASVEALQGQPPNSADLTAGCASSDRHAFSIDWCQRVSVTPARRGRSPDRLSPRGRNCLGGNSGAWQGCAPGAGSKAK